MGTTESTLVEPLELDDAPIQQTERYSNASAHKQRPRVSSTTTKPFLKHNGLILGLPSSGKRTLLKRLEGKDPFLLNTSEKETKWLNQVTVPFHTSSIIWDRLLLHVRIPDHRHNAIDIDIDADFAVVLVHPQHDPTLVQTYLATILSSLLQQRTGPLALSVLLNFRDLQQKCHPLIQEEDLQSLVDETLNQYPHRQQVLVQIGTTSLKNCYGLYTLHHFIYRSYLLKKQIEWKDQLKICQQQIHDTNTVTTVPYDEFLQLIQPSKGATTSSNVPLHDNDDNLVASGNPAATGPRSLGLLPKPHEQGLPYIGTDPTKSLEAFFADSDEDEPCVQTTFKKNTTRDNDDDNEYDDDYFYDEVGQRMSTLQEISSSDWSTPANIIPIPAPDTHWTAPVSPTAEHDVVEYDTIPHRDMATNEIQPLVVIPPISPPTSVVNESDLKTILKEAVSDNGDDRKIDDWNHESHDVVVDEPSPADMEMKSRSAHDAPIESSNQKGLDLEPTPSTSECLIHDKGEGGGNASEDDVAFKETFEEQTVVVANATAEEVTPFVNDETNPDVMELAVDGFDQSPERQVQLATEYDDDVGTDMSMPAMIPQRFTTIKPFHVDNSNNDDVMIDNGVSNSDERTAETSPLKGGVPMCISEPRLGLSQAALAAILAAEEQARSMLVEEVVKSVMTEKKKKAKEQKDRKKERKKKKEIKRTVTSSTGSATGTDQQIVGECDSDW